MSFLLTTQAALPQRHAEHLCVAPYAYVRSEYGSIAHGMLGQGGRSCGFCGWVARCAVCLSPLLTDSREVLPRVTCPSPQSVLHDTLRRVVRS